MVQDFPIVSDGFWSHIRHRLKCNEVKNNSYQKINMKTQETINFQKKKNNKYSSMYLFITCGRTFKLLTSYKFRTYRKFTVIVFLFFTPKRNLRM